MLIASFVLIFGVMGPYGYEEHPPYAQFTEKAACETEGRAHVDRGPRSAPFADGSTFAFAGYRCEPGTAISDGSGWLRQGVPPK